MKSKAIIVAVFLLAAGGIFWGTQRTPTGPSSVSRATGNRTRVSILYSTEKKEWLEAVAQDFQKDHPEIDVALEGMGSLDAAQGILEGKLKPTVWSPADSGVLGLLASDWQTKNGAALFAESGEDAPSPLVITPLVFVAWEDRAQALTHGGKQPMSWKVIHDAVADDRGWPSVGGKAEWGFVKLGHTDPTKSNSGLQTLLLMTFDFYKKSQGLTVDDLLRPDYQAWVRETEKGVRRFEASSGTFMTDMVRFGPSKYDVAVVYENLAASQIENAQGRWGNLRVYYPQVTLWSDHPAAVLNTAWVSPEQRTAARQFLGYLRSKPAQERALRLGFRPASTNVALKTADPSNPFTRLASYGIQVDIPPVATPPDASVIRNLLSMWSRVVPRSP